RPAALDVGALAPDAVGQQGQFFEKGALAIIDDLLHHALDRVRAIAADERQDPILGRHVARELRAEVERYRARFPRAAQIDLFDVAPDLVLLHDLHRRDQDALVEGVARRGTEAAGRDAADVVLVQAVCHPAEEPALPGPRAE